MSIGVKIFLIYCVQIFNKIFVFLVFIRALLSWFPIIRDGIIYSIIYNLTEPILAPVRNILSRSPLGGSSGMMIDFSPIFAILLVEAICRILILIIQSV